MQRLFGKVSLLVAFLIAGVVLLVRFVRPDTTLTWADIIGLLAPLIVFVFSRLRPGLDPERDPERQIEEARRELAARVRTQWHQEARDRKLVEPLRIRLVSAAHDLAARPVDVVGDDIGGSPVRLHFTSDVSELADEWRRLPYGRIIVIGQPGAGKTSAAVVFVHDLLKEPLPTDPVPVLLSLTGWNPREDFGGWLAARVLSQYPTLGDRGRFGRDPRWSGATALSICRISTITAPGTHFRL